MNTDTVQEKHASLGPGYDEMRNTLLLIQRGLRSGHIRSKPILEPAPPEATEMGFKSLGDIVAAALKATKP